MPESKNHFLNFFKVDVKYFMKINISSSTKSVIGVTFHGYSGGLIDYSAINASWQIWSNESHSKYVTVIVGFFVAIVFVVLNLVLFLATVVIVVVVVE